MSNVSNTYRLEERAVLADVAGGREAEPAHQPRAHVRHDVTVQVRHHLEYMQSRHVGINVVLFPLI